MFNRASSFAIVLALPLLAAATAVPRTDSPSCTTGSIQCCNSVQNSNPLITSLLSGLLGIALPNIVGLIGLTCSPLTIIGGGGTSCSSQPVCCTNNQFNGLINLGCSPINLNL